MNLKKLKLKLFFPLQKKFLFRFEHFDLIQIDHSKVFTTQLLFKLEQLIFLERFLKQRLPKKHKIIT
jgi:hypothetical protein